MPTKGPFQPSQLHVLCVISNPARYRSRAELYRKFAKMVEDAGATLWTCEVAFGDRPFEVTNPGNPHHLQCRTFFELWHKENMANLLAQRLPQDWEYLALVDADITFARGPDWPVETIQMLQHHYVVQMWSHAEDLGPDYQVIARHEGLMYRYVNGLPIGGGYGYKFGHPGYAWAYRREAFDHLGGFLDTAILGAADHHMGLALIGRGAQSVPGNINQAYFDEVMRWEERALRYLTKDVGYVKGTINHWWHGRKASRKYVERWGILTRNDYVPYLDLKRDWQGLYQLTDRNPQLRDEIRAYFAQRNEDGQDL